MNTRSQKFLKNTLLAAGILLTCGIAEAQAPAGTTGALPGNTAADSTHHQRHGGGGRRVHRGDADFGRGFGVDRGHGEFGRGFDGGAGSYGLARHGHGAFAHRRHRNGIHYTPEQRQQLAAINKDFRDKSAALYQKDNITLKEYKSSLATLRKEKRAKMDALLTPQQKDQIAKRKQMASENRQVAAAARMERLKLRLNLTDDQVSKIKAGQAALHQQAKAIHENENLQPREKMEQMKGLIAKRKDVFKSVLTPEQQTKFEEMMSHRHEFGRGGRGGWERGKHAMEDRNPENGGATAI